MGEQRVVFGAGLSALRAAACLAVAGEAVMWLDPSADESITGDDSLEHAPWRAADGPLDGLEQIIGPLRPAEGRLRRLSWGGRTATLPLRPLDRARLIGLRHARGPLIQLLRARARNAIAEAIGGGVEERSYADWVARRFGLPVAQRRFASYARRRWGQTADALSASTARWHHYVHHDSRLVLPTEPHGGAARMTRALHASGGARRSGVQLRGLHVEAGRVVALELEGGERIACARPPWLALDPPSVAALLPDSALPADLRVIAARCAALDRVVLELVDPDDAPAQELHLLDEAPFWMAARGEGRLLLVSTIAADEPLDADLHQQRCLDACHLMGIAARGEGRPRLRRFHRAQPSWGPQTHALLRDLLLAWDRLGVVVFGRQGALADLDPLEELRLAVALRGDGEGPVDQREAQRTIAEPSAREDDVLAPIAPFITR